MKKFFVITTPKVIETNEISFYFMFQSNAPREKLLWGEAYGVVTLKEKDENFINPFRLVRGEPNAIGPDGKKQWKIDLGKGARQIFGGSVDEELEQEAGLRELIAEMPSATLLMQRDIFDRFEKAAQALDVTVDLFHCDFPLVTNQRR